MIISYEDAAKVILDNMDRNIQFRCKRAGIALSVGEPASKNKLQNRMLTNPK